MAPAILGEGIRARRAARLHLRAAPVAQERLAALLQSLRLAKMVRYLTSVSPGYVYALALLVLLSVRGYHGNLWAGSFIATKQNLLGNNFNEFVQRLLDGHKAETKFEPHAWAGHGEGRHAQTRAPLGLQPARVGLQPARVCSRGPPVIA